LLGQPIEHAPGVGLADHLVAVPAGHDRQLYIDDQSVLAASVVELVSGQLIDFLDQAAAFLGLVDGLGCAVDFAKPD
jgi:hypothetical protein